MALHGFPLIFLGQFNLKHILFTAFHSKLSCDAPPLFIIAILLKVCKFGSFLKKYFISSLKILDTLF